MDELLTTKIPLPVIALRGYTVFPQQLASFDVERSASVEALKAGNKLDRLVFLITQKDAAVDIPEASDLYTIGTVARIRQFVQIPGNSINRVLVEGLYRARSAEINTSGNFITGRALKLKDLPEHVSETRITAMVRSATGLFEEYIQATKEFAPEQILNLIANPDPSYVADYIGQYTPLDFDKKQLLLEELHPVKRLGMAMEMLNRELEILNIEKEISEAASEAMQQSQREYLLREEMKVIQEELGNTSASETDEYRAKIQALPVSEQVKEKLLKDVSRLEKEPYGSSEASVLRSYLDTCLELPWGKYSKERIALDRARKILDNEHYGLEKVKERIIEYLAVKKLTPDIKGGLICLVGPPGTGKTSIAKSVAHATGRELVRLSLGGVHDEAEIRGHRKTYIGSMPGRIIDGITRSKVCNPVMVLDEIDKLGSDYKGDPASALLEVFDSEQNATFRDHYLEIPFDLSEVLFITTANTTDTIPRALLDRMEIIELSSYTDEEKKQIAKRHLIAKQRKKHGLDAKHLKISDKALGRIIAEYTRESGVRVLERQIAKICRKAAAEIADNPDTLVQITDKNLEQYLGVPRFKEEEKRSTDSVGLVRGLAWTESGGEVLDCETAVVDGTGKIELTGNLGDVMKESAKAAITYIRGRAGELGVSPDFYKDKDIHIHFPEGAVPKDGPSAGITVCTAIISALTGIPVRSDVAMTGEITLRGRVLPIGGLREKTMAALRSGVKTVIVPKDNEKDLEEIDPLVKAQLNFVFASTMDDVLPHALRYCPVKETVCPPSISVKPSSSVPRRNRTSSSKAPLNP